MRMYLFDTLSIADLRWRDWIYFVLSVAIVIYMVLGSQHLYKRVIVYFERKYRVKIVSRVKAHVVTGPHPWWKLLWIEIKLMASFFIIYFFPLVLIGLIGWMLGVFR